MKGLDGATLENLLETMRDGTLQWHKEILVLPNKQTSIAVLKSIDTSLILASGVFMENQKVFHALGISYWGEQSLFIKDYFIAPDLITDLLYYSEQPDMLPGFDAHSKASYHEFASAFSEINRSIMPVM